MPRVGGVPVLASDLPDLGPGRAGHVLAARRAAPLREPGERPDLPRRARASQFDDDDLRLLQILSDQAAVAIENARLLSGRDQLVHELGALLEVSEAAGTASDEIELAERTRRLAAHAQPVPRRPSCRAGTRARPCCASSGATASADRRRVDVAESPVRRDVLRDGRPVVIQADSAPTDCPRRSSCAHRRDVR